ncbi:MAG TPA: NADH-quinone oxidoreductase subunit L, partial [Dissulfurispiraceae bacterium]|nr:NADH-quinone oxidoreductase subunit L [Dissulfurispiraceae bacterium]
EEFMVMGISIACAVGGILVSWIFYSLKPEIPKNLVAKFKGIYNVLWNKYYVDELYDSIIIRPTMWIACSVLIPVTDGTIIEGIVNGVPKAIAGFGERLRKLQTGSVQHYALTMAIGLFVLLSLVLIYK